MKFLYWLFKTAAIRGNGAMYLVMALIFALSGQYLAGLLFFGMFFTLFSGIWLGIIIQYKNEVPENL